MDKTNNFQQAAWKRLRKNKGGIFGLFMIGLAIVVAIFAYFIAPDPSPYANRIILEVGGQKPGFKQGFLKIKKQKPVETPNFFQRLVSGKEDPYYYLPVTQSTETKDSVHVQKYIDEGVTEAQSYSKKDLAEIPVVSKNFYLGTDKYGRDILSRLIIGVRVSLSVGFITVVISLTIGLLLGSVAGYFRGRTDDIVMWFINIIWSIPTLLLVFAITLLLGKGFGKYLLLLVLPCG
jgi:ABC-type dipeptide/oligopeptide/nickel transport system permease subunit